MSAKDCLIRPLRGVSSKEPFGARVVEGVGEGLVGGVVGGVCG